jgi:hypothetical protein
MLPSNVGFLARRTSLFGSAAGVGFYCSSSRLLRRQSCVQGGFLAACAARFKSAAGLPLFSWSAMSPPPEFQEALLRGEVCFAPLGSLATLLRGTQIGAHLFNSGRTLFGRHLRPLLFHPGCSFFGRTPTDHAVAAVRPVHQTRPVCAIVSNPATFSIFPAIPDPRLDGFQDGSNATAQERQDPTVLSCAGAVHVGVTDVLLQADSRFIRSKPDISNISSSRVFQRVDDPVHPSIFR